MLLIGSIENCSLVLTYRRNAPLVKCWALVFLHMYHAIFVPQDIDFYGHLPCLLTLNMLSKVCKKTLFVYCFSSFTRTLHSNGDVTIIGEGPKLGACGHLALRHLSYAKFTVIWDHIHGIICNRCMYVGTNVSISLCVSFFVFASFVLYLIDMNEVACNCV